ncbi:uncharacterized protein LOC128165357 [Crassostrea angulata]|uniref:uncharacterized protein LOC128165357 n=1 Tax=Magallana angulata TaxID=2784310 RepID=UPI0022B1E9DB|nr:uncharacterized protein LOC128165357 [Crassostrea angulata]
MFRYLLVFSLTFLLLTEDVYAWRRLRKFFRKVGRVIKRIPKEAANAVKTIAQVRTAVDAVKGVGAAVGKRSTDDEIFELNVCDFQSFDLDDDQRISETELSILIDITGLMDLDEFFEQMDNNKDDVVTLEEYNSSQLIKEACT